MIERDFAVQGMHCEACVALISEDVGDLDGVEAVAVDLAAGRAHVRFDPGRVDNARIVNAIRHAGYDAAPL